MSLIILFANFMSVGLLTHQWAPFLFIGVVAITGAGLSVAESILLLDSFPEARGGVMAIRSAGAEIGIAMGAMAVGILLVLFADYGTVFRALGLLLPLSLVAMLVSKRGRPPSSQPKSVPLSSPSAS
jgi:predicted MFS family arabinose efflux permease